MKEVLLLTNKVDRAGTVISEISSELRNHDRRLIRLETMVEMAQAQSLPKIDPK